MMETQISENLSYMAMVYYQVLHMKFIDSTRVTNSTAVVPQ